MGADVVAIELLKAVFGEAASRGLSAVLERLQSRRAKEAYEIILEELAWGEVPPFGETEQDDFAAMLYRFMRAAHEGAGRRNLRLMAQVLRGDLMQRPIPISHFSKWANILDDLTHEEIVFIVTLLGCLRAGPKIYKFDQSHGFAYRDAQNKLIPDTFADSDAMERTASALMRTGLVLGEAAWNGTAYRLSSLADELESICRLNEI